MGDEFPLPLGFEELLDPPPKGDPPPAEVTGSEEEETVGPKASAEGEGAGVRKEGATPPDRGIPKTGLGEFAETCEGN